MHYSHTKFRISAWVAELIKLSEFSATTAKLLFALIFLQDQTDEGWPGIDELYEQKDYFVPVKQLRELGLPSKTRSSLFLRKPVAELAANPVIFEHLEIGPNGRYLTWRFSADFFDMMADMEVYGLLDASEIGLCQGKFGGALLAQIPLHRKKRIPEFRLFGPQNGFELQLSYPLPKLVPSLVQRQILPQLQKWADIGTVTFAVLLVQEGSHPGYTNVVIRMRHKETEWPKNRFVKRSPSARFWTVSPAAIAPPENSAA